MYITCFSRVSVSIATASIIAPRKGFRNYIAHQPYNWIFKFSFPHIFYNQLELLITQKLSLIINSLIKFFLKWSLITEPLQYLIIYLHFCSLLIGTSVTWPKAVFSKIVFKIILIKLYSNPLSWLARSHCYRSTFWKTKDWSSHFWESQTFRFWYVEAHC